MAIEHDIVIAASPSQSAEIHLANFDSDFGEYRVSTSNVKIDKMKPQWYDYFLSGYQGILDKFNLEKGCGKGVVYFGTVVSKL